MVAVCIDRAPSAREPAVLAKNLLVESDRVIRKRDRSENSLHRGTRLERVLHRGVVKTIVNAGGIGADVCHRDHFTGEGIEHNSAAALGAALLTFGRELGLRERLDRGVYCQFGLPAWFGALRRNRPFGNRMPKSA